MATVSLDILTGTYQIPEKDLMTEGLIGFRLRRLTCQLKPEGKGLGIWLENKRIMVLSEEDTSKRLKGEVAQVAPYISGMLVEGYKHLLEKFFTTETSQLGLVRQQLGRFEAYIYPEDVYKGKIRTVDEGKNMASITLEERIDGISKQHERLSTEESVHLNNFIRAGIRPTIGLPVYFTPVYIKDAEITPMLFWPQTSAHARP